MRLLVTFWDNESQFVTVKFWEDSWEDFWKGIKCFNKSTTCIQEMIYRFHAGIYWWLVHSLNIFRLEILFNQLINIKTEIVIHRDKGVQRQPWSFLHRAIRFSLCTSRQSGSLYLCQSWSGKRHLTWFILRLLTVSCKQFPFNQSRGSKELIIQMNSGTSIVGMIGP